MILLAVFAMAMAFGLPYLIDNSKVSPFSLPFRP